MMRSEVGELGKFATKKQKKKKLDCLLLVFSLGLNRLHSRQSSLRFDVLLFKYISHGLC